jgi:hypothetical protein
VRRFSLSASVRDLYVFAASLKIDPDTKKKFDLFAAYPRKNLLESLSQSVEAAGVGGSQVIMSWR